MPIDIKNMRINISISGLFYTISSDYHE